MHYGRGSTVNEIEKVRLKILKAKIENKPPLVIQKLQQELDRLSREKQNGNV